MPWSGSGTYSLPPAYTPEVNGTTIDAARYNGATNDIAAGITACLAKNGENVPTANLPMGGFKHTGAADGSAAGQYMTWGNATGKLGNLDVTANTLPPNGFYLPAANTLGVATNTTQRATVNSTGNVVVNAASSGITLETVAAAGNVYFSGGDTAVARRLQFSTATTTNAGDTQLLNATGATGVYKLGANGVYSIVGTAAGNVAINTPASGVALTVNEVAGQNFLNATDGTHAGSFRIDASGLVIGTTTNFGFQVYTNNSTRLDIGNAGNVTVNAPSSGITVDINGVSGAATALRVTSGASGNTAGIFTDGSAPFYIIPSSASSKVQAGTILNQSLNLISNNVERVLIGGSGNVTINAPSSGTTLAISAVSGGTALTTSGTAGNTAIQSTDGTNTFQVIPNGASGTLLRVTTNHNLSLQTNSTEQLVVTNDGRVYGKSLHNNAGAVTGTTNQYIASGTYTPTLTNGGNVDASTTQVAQWMRVGNVCTVSGQMSIDVNTASTQSNLTISLPIASDFTSTIQLAGTAVEGIVGAAPAASTILANVANNVAEMTWRASTSVTNAVWSYHFTYVVV